MSISIVEKRSRFRRLHESGCFVIPNPWDVGSARLLERMGFKALASSSAGFAWTIGRPDGAARVGEVLAHLEALAESVDLPINADFEHGYSHQLDGLMENVSLAVDTGIAGLSIEDSTGDPEAPLFELDEAVARIRAARAAIDRIDPAVMLIGRCECYLVGRPDIQETARRVKAYAEAGADCLFAPGTRIEKDIRAVVAAVAPKPVNVVVSGAGSTVAELAAMGVRRISTGGSLARVALTAVLGAAKAIADDGSFAAFADAVPSSEINGSLADYMIHE